MTVENVFIVHKNKGINKMKLAQNILFITYYLKTDKNKLDVICKGCREIVYPDYEMPPYIKGMIELDGDSVLVIDPSIYFVSKQSELKNLACILVIEHVYKCCNCKAGIILEDIDDIMNLAAGSYDSDRFVPSTYNMKFVLNALKRGSEEQFLSNTQMLIEISNRQKSILKSPLKMTFDTVLKEESLDFIESAAFNTNEFLVTI